MFKIEIKNQQLIIQMLTSNKNGRNQWKSSKSINPDFLDRPETPAPINLTMDLKVFIQQKKIKDL